MNGEERGSARGRGDRKTLERHGPEEIDEKERKFVRKIAGPKRQCEVKGVYLLSLCQVKEVKYQNIWAMSEDIRLDRTRFPGPWDQALHEESGQKSLGNNRKHGRIDGNHLYC